MGLLEDRAVRLHRAASDVRGAFTPLKRSVSPAVGQPSGSPISGRAGEVEEDLEGVGSSTEPLQLTSVGGVQTGPAGRRPGQALGLGQQRVTSSAVSWPLQSASPSRFGAAVGSGVAVG